MTIPGVIITGDNYHVGTIFDGTAPANVGPYQANGVSVPGQGWLQEWNDVPPPVVKRTPAEIVAANQMFAFGDTGCKYYDVSALPYTVMGASSIQKYMPQTGERPDIGLITDWSAWFMLKGDASPTIQIALAAASVPMHYRDETTGLPIDLLKYPGANCYSQNNQGSPWMPTGPIVGGWPSSPDGWTPQQAHYPEMSYMAFMATLHGPFLRDLQYSANFTILCDAYLSNHLQPKTATISGEVRGIGWALRNLFMAHVATKYAESLGTLPDGCHPSSYFKALLDNQIAYWSAQMGGASQKIFHTWYNEADKYSPWTEDYLAMALAFGVLTDHPEWISIFLFKLGNTIARCSGKSGWPPCVPTPYRIPTLGYTTWAEAFDGLMTEPEVMMSQAAHDKIIADPINGGFLSDQEPYGYHFTTRAVLVMADYLDKKGLANVRGAYPDFDIALKNMETMFLNFGSVNPRVSVVLSSDPITPQPPTEIEMSDTKLAIGETKHLTLAITPADADQTGLAYTAAPDGLVTLAPDATGVSVTRVSKGTATIEADLNGLKATAEALDAIPLADAIALSWDS